MAMLFIIYAENDIRPGGGKREFFLHSTEDVYIIEGGFIESEWEKPIDHVYNVR